ncbi:MAG: hypothetical protein ACFFDQ_08260 [Candidatus Thorarchaeota archaeon]
MELERVLTKLKFDESVSGYALITSDGHPFLSFSLPDDVLPQIKGTLRIHGNDLKLVNIMTNSGIVILARVNSSWVLAVLFEPDFQLGGALSRTKAVVDLLVQVNLPLPPASIAAEEVILPTEEKSVVESELATSEISSDMITEDVLTHEPEKQATMETVATVPLTETPKEMAEVKHGCIVHRGDNYKHSVTLDSELNASIKRLFANVGIDVLLIVDEKMTVYKLAELLARPVQKIVEIVKWCVSRNILWVDCPEGLEPSQREIIELPLFEGKIDKVKKQHRAILERCNGKKTLQEIATEMGIPYFEALQMIIPYRGKSVRFIRIDKASRF